ncbi:NUDIX domain-containing protein [Paramicrobacterium agarici]|uniref:NUDIX domain-containing protein n=1 Tax=Paramicrobacterium agarici TaxID=630514 RepID=UPI0011541894|nr:NUDIX hydrolase [Microbacterium agarici]TQO24149.1 ADP-ribose pyrophosphatase [Microbacterium agarici]
MTAEPRPLHDEPVEAELESTEIGYHGYIWDVRRDTFRLNDSSITREYLDHTGAVAILALDEHDRVLLINQYRHPVRARLWEIPAGLLDVTAERPLDAAKRELAEEADVEAREWAVLSEFYTSPGASDEAIRIYLARDIHALPERFDREDEEAGIEKRWVSLDEIADAVRARAVQNPSLVNGVLSAFVARQRGWDGLGPADADWPRLRQRGAAE